MTVSGLVAFLLIAMLAWHLNFRVGSIAKLEAVR
jgi:hypothetical protein